MPETRHVLSIVFTRELFDKLAPFLSRNSLDVETVTSGKGALVLLSNLPHGLIVVEHPLPDMELEELLAAIRRPGAPSAEATVMVLTNEDPRSLRDGLDHRRLSCHSRSAGADELMSEIAARLGVAARRACRLPVKLRVEIGPAEFLHHCQTVDISESGALLRSARLLPVHSELDLSFSLPGDPRVIEVRARVVRQVEKDGRPIGLGVHFTEMDDEERTLLSRFIGASAGEPRTGRPLTG